jgi:hypothetical protein
MTRDIGRDGPPDDEPLVLSDKFVTPADAIVWLDPSQFDAGQGTLVQFESTLAQDDLPEGAERLPDDWTPDQP